MNKNKYLHRKNFIYVRNSKTLTRNVSVYKKYLVITYYMYLDVNTYTFCYIVFFFHRIKNYKMYVHRFKISVHTWNTHSLSNSSCYFQKGCLEHRLCQLLISSHCSSGFTPTRQLLFTARNKVYDFCGIIYSTLLCYKLAFCGELQRKRDGTKYAVAA